VVVITADGPQEVTVESIPDAKPAFATKPISGIAPERKQA
jgi:hypothetical protein